MVLFGPNFKKMIQGRDLEALVLLSCHRGRGRREEAKKALKQIRTMDKAAALAINETKKRFIEKLLMEMEGPDPKTCQEACRKFRGLTLYDQDYPELDRQLREQVLRVVVGVILNSESQELSKIARNCFCTANVGCDLDILVSSGALRELLDVLVSGKDEERRVVAAECIYNALAGLCRDDELLIKMKEISRERNLALLERPEKEGVFDELLSFCRTGPDTDTREWALDVFGAMLYPGNLKERLPDLLSFHDDPRDGLRCKAIEILGDVLCDIIETEALKGCGDVNELVGTILARFGDKDLYVRETALNALADVMETGKLDKRFREPMLSSAMEVLKAQIEISASIERVHSLEKQCRATLLKNVCCSIMTMIMEGGARELVEAGLIEVLVEAFHRTSHLRKLNLRDVIFMTLKRIRDAGLEEELVKRGGLDLLKKAKPWQIDSRAALWREFLGT